MAQDEHQQAKEEFDDARDAMADQYKAMLADLRFSDPSDPQQWDAKAKELRTGRPCLTFDRTNQFIAQVVNQARQNKPSIRCMPADSKADIEVAEQLNGIVRHIEYVSRAGIAYDTAIEYAARIGLGWIRVVPEIMRSETNWQEIRIKRIADPLSCHLEAGWSEPDGSDAMVGFIETKMTTKAFKRQWPKAKTDSWESDGWFEEETVRICERFKIVETKQNKLVIDAGEQMVLSEEEYWALAKQIGYKPPVLSQFEAKTRSVKWQKLSGCEVLEETDFPSQYLPLIPVIGHELMVDGKRHLCGMTRRIMDGQRFHNYELSALIESMAMQPKAPLLMPFEGMEGHEVAYATLHQGNPAVLPYNHVDGNGIPIPAPTRLAPPLFPNAFAQGGLIGANAMEAALGMYKPSLGAQSNAVSGRAKREDKVAGDTANFHYTDNLARSIEQLGRVIVDMIPRVYDTKRQARIVGEDGGQDFVQIDPEMQEASQKKGKKVVSINPNVGAYDVRVKTGPAYTTLREEQAEQLAGIMQSAPALTPILADLWVSAQDFPDSDKAAKRLAMMLPPQIQQMEADDGEEMSPAVMAQISQKDQQIAELSQALEAAHGEHMQLEGEMKSHMQVEQMKAQAKAETDRQARAHELQMATIQATQAQEDAERQLQIAREKNSSAFAIAELNAKVAMAQSGVDQAMAAQALQAEQILEGRKLAIQAQTQSEKIAADKEKQTNDLASKADLADRAAKAKPEAAKPEAKPEAKTEDFSKHLEPLHAAIKELQANASKPRKSTVKITKQADGSFVGEKVES